MNPAARDRPHAEIDVPASGLVYITGSSGSGKSTLLRRMMERLKLTCPPGVQGLPTSGSVLDLFEGAETAEVAGWLDRFGLGGARLLGETPPVQLSKGQRHRLVLALLLWARPGAICVDDFCSVLDRTTAFMVARSIHDICREHGITGYLATGHDDLIAALWPDHVVRLHFDGGATVTPGASEDAFLPWLEAAFEEGLGTLADLEALSGYHDEEKEGDRPIDWDQLLVEVRVVRFRGRAVAVKVLTRPFPAALEVLPLFGELNQRIVVQERLIVHPAFRGIAPERGRMDPSPGTQQVVVAQSALRRHLTDNLKAGFTRVPHPSESPSAAQGALIVELVGLADADDFDPRAADPVLALLETLDPETLRRLQGAARLAMVETLIDHVSYLGELVDRPLTSRDVAHLTRLFDQAPGPADPASVAQLIESAMPAPMAGFVKRLGLAPTDE